MAVGHEGGVARCRRGAQPEPDVLRVPGHRHQGVPRDQHRGTGQRGGDGDTREPAHESTGRPRSGGDHPRGQRHRGGHLQQVVLPVAAAGGDRAHREGEQRRQRPVLGIRTPPPGAQPAQPHPDDRHHHGEGGEEEQLVEAGGGRPEAPVQDHGQGVPAEGDDVGPRAPEVDAGGQGPPGHQGVGGHGADDEAGRDGPGAGRDPAPAQPVGEQQHAGEHEAVREVLLHQRRGGRERAGQDAVPHQPGRVVRVPCVQRRGHRGGDEHGGEELAVGLFARQGGAAQQGRAHRGGAPGPGRAGQQHPGARQGEDADDHERDGDHPDRRVRLPQRGEPVDGHQQRGPVDLVVPVGEPPRPRRPVTRRHQVAALVRAQGQPDVREAHRDGGAADQHQERDGRGLLPAAHGSRGRVLDARGPSPVTALPGLTAPPRGGGGTSAGPRRRWRR